MKHILPVLAIAVSIISLTAQKAMAYCDVILGADVIENVIAGGGSFQDAVRVAKKQGRIDNNDCILEVRGYIIRNSETHPRASKLIKKGP
jgi:hypothetical protein